MVAETCAGALKLAATNAMGSQTGKIFTTIKRTPGAR
jgi:hypothetical protein